MDFIILKETVRFRTEEDGYILLCDCETLENFELPSEYEVFLLKLQIGCAVTILDKDEQMLLEDLIELELVTDNKDLTHMLSGLVWEAMNYNENEFY